MKKFLAIYGKPRYLGFVELPEELELEKGELIRVDTNRGDELALLVGEISEDQVADYAKLRTYSEHGDGRPKNSEPLVAHLTYKSVPGEREMELVEEFRAEETEILHAAQDILGLHELDMKFVDAEFMLDKRKLFLYFTSDHGVDFRSLVRDLAREFKTRIELRQVGARDEAKIVKGLSSCGMECCCSYWLNQFAPINIRMVKEQNLALNPAKISGICGRLMCCMCFEHQVYHELWVGMPNPGTKVKTPIGNYQIAGMDVRKKALRCHCPHGRDKLIPIERFQEFKETVMRGEEWTSPYEEEDAQVARVRQIRESLSGYTPSEESKARVAKARHESATIRKEAVVGDGEEGPDANAPARKSRRRRRRKPAGERDAATQNGSPASGGNAPNVSKSPATDSPVSRAAPPAKTATPPQGEDAEGEKAAKRRRRPRRRRSGSGKPPQQEKAPE